MTSSNSHGETASPVPSPSATTPSAKEDSGPSTVEKTASDQHESNAQAADPPLPDEEAPPLPDEAPPDPEDDGWEHQWDYTAGAWYFYNKRTGRSQWENPRVPDATVNSSGPHDRTISTTSGAPGTTSAPKRKWGGYNPAIHGSYDPNADYAKEASKEEEEAEQAEAAAAAAAAGLPNPRGQDYAATAQFNRFTGKFQQAEMGPEMHNDENKSKRQMNAFFDVDAAANSHDGRSLKAERRGQNLTKKELKAFKDKRRDKKEEKRRAWLRD